VGVGGATNLFSVLFEVEHVTTWPRATGPPDEQILEG
jgi:hypothetical protein